MEIENGEVLKEEQPPLIALLVLMDCKALISFVILLRLVYAKTDLRNSAQQDIIVLMALQLPAQLDNISLCLVKLAARPAKTVLSGIIVMIQVYPLRNHAHQAIIHQVIGRITYLNVQSAIKEVAQVWDYQTASMMEGFLVPQATFARMAPQIQWEHHVPSISMEIVRIYDQLEIVLIAHKDSIALQGQHGSDIKVTRMILVLLQEQNRFLALKVGTAPLGRRQNAQQVVGTRLEELSR